MKKNVTITVFAYLIFNLTFSQQSNCRGIWKQFRYDIPNNITLGTNGVFTNDIDPQFTKLDSWNSNVANRRPFKGLKFQINWGSLYNADGSYNFETIKYVLNQAETKNYKIILAIADKLFSYPNSNPNRNYTYAGGAVPPIFDGNGSRDGSCAEPFPIAASSSTICQTSNDYEGYFDEPYRYAQQKVNTGQIGVRLYIAKQWAIDDNGTADEADDVYIVQEAWRNMWTDLANYEYEPGKLIKNHPALHAVTSAESSLALPNFFNDSVFYDQYAASHFGYPGPEWYANYLVDLVAFWRATFPPNVVVISNINWLQNNKKPNHNPNLDFTPENDKIYQYDVAEGFVNLNGANTEASNNNIAWWSQDLVYERFPEYNKWVYPQVEKFPTSLNYAVITGESWRSSNGADSETEIATRLLGFTNPGNSNVNDIIGTIGNLVINNDKIELLNIIYNASPGDYPFLEETCSVDQNYLIMHLNFEEGTGVNAMDSSSFTNNGVLNNANWYTDLSNCSDYLNVTNNNSKVVVNQDSSLNPSDKFTVASWIALNSLDPQSDGNQDVILTKGNGSGLNYRLGIANNSGNKAQLRVKLNGTEEFVNGTTNITPSKWYHIAATYDGATIKLYVNGVEEGSKLVSGFVTSNTDDVTLASNPFGGLSLDGYIDDVRIYNYNISLLDLQNLANDCVRSFPQTLDVDHFNASELEIYPNPVQTELTVSAKVKIDKVTVYNVLGQEVLIQNNVNKKVLQVNVSNMPQGAYFVKIALENNKTKIYRLIKE